MIFSAKREIHKTLEIEGVEYRIRKMSALEGSNYMIVLLSMALPLGINVGLQQLGMETAPQNIRPMDQATFRKLQMDCLRLCDVRYPAGWTPVLNDNGSFAVPELEYDILAVMGLTAQVILWTFGGFFDAGRFSSWIGPFLGPLQSILTSMPGNTPPSSPESGNNTSFGTEPTPSTTF